MYSDLICKQVLLGGKSSCIINTNTKTETFLQAVILHRIRNKTTLDLDEKKRVVNVAEGFKKV